MITSLELSGFKRFKQQSFNFAPLTLLAGVNGSGKTSLIQALLLLATSCKNSFEPTVALNGPYDLDLGVAENVRNWLSTSGLVVEVHSESTGLAKWRFDAPAADALYLDVKERPNALPFAFTEAPRALTFLSAERLGPRGVSGKSPVALDRLEVGARGEFTAQILSAYGGKPLGDADRRHPGAGDGEVRLLKYEIEHWLAEIARPVEINADLYPDNATISALRFKSPGGELVSAPNMGFGVSYALPVITGGLIAAKDGLFIVENPEAHLHPAGQSRMGVFLAWLASRGVQVLIETHSDHVLNGIRRAVVEHKYLDASAGVVQYFDTEETGLPSVKRLDFLASGSMSDWPSGFFDQYQVDVSSLARGRSIRSSG